MTSTIRVLLIDDHALFRSGVRLLLQRQPGVEVVAEASDALEGIKRAKELVPDIILLDLHMPGMSGLDAITLLREEVPQSHIIMLTVSEDSEDLTRALRAGAAGYLIKNIDAQVFVDALRRVMDGESVISNEMTARLVASLRQPRIDIPADHTEKLTPRECDILGELALGMSNKEIARKLDLAESTVKIHLQSILRKLELSNRVQAAIYAVEHGMGGARK
ncbi:response regulator [Orrella marina]|uniref:DNA-binding response regulator n=1 Tax=Orrella marina TaxID=2163011 RepID=A0A2R4XN67_9BURK|nr:response regulator transcription factor [Orrella marina]AWB35228.1 DNA-binding response regulator [Orrella marina]